MAIQIIRQIAFGVLLFVGAAPVWSKQLPVSNPSDQEVTFTANAEFLLLDVDVKDQKGGYVSNLDKENFRVYENGKRQTISHFSHQDLPATVGLVIDSSGSMRAKRREVITAALAFVGASNQSDEMFVMHFNDHVRRGLPDDTLFSNDPNVLRTALWKPAVGRTALYDGVLESLHQLDLGTRSKKALILISDGGDNASTHKIKDVMVSLRATEAIIYTIGIFDEADPEVNPALLRQMASISGGEAFFPHELEELQGICRQIATDIRHRYTIGYVPPRVDGKGAFRTIRVVAMAGTQKLKVRARTGYVLPEGSRQGL